MQSLEKLVVFAYGFLPTYHTKNLLVVIYVLYI